MNGERAVSGQEIDQAEVDARFALIRERYGHSDRADSVRRRQAAHRGHRRWRQASEGRQARKQRRALLGVRSLQKGARRRLSDLAFRPVRDLSELVRTRRVSSVELAETFLDRLEGLGPQLNAMVTVTRESALREARRADEEIGRGEYRGPLHGIPYGAKDLLATVGTLRRPGAPLPFATRPSTTMRRSSGSSGTQGRCC